MTAQDQLRALLREDIAPRLRAAGFTGTERRFSLLSDEYFAQIGIQSSVASTCDDVKFTATLQVISKSQWMNSERRLPMRPSPNVGYGLELGWDARIGSLMGVGDRWWWLDARGSQRGAVARELGDALLSVGLTALRERMT